MKTLKKLFSGAMMVFLFVALLTGCSDTPTSIEIKQMPSATFEVGTASVNPLMVVKVSDADGKTTDNIELNYANGVVTSDPAGFEVKLNGFDLAKAGSFTASVEYGGAVSYFDYQVVAKDNLFAGGDGSSKNPYQITTAEQLLNINSVETTTDKYFKLMNDIDMSSVSASFEYGGSARSYINSQFSGTFEGNNKKIFNIDTSKEEYEEVTLFSEVTNATIKDLSIYVNSNHSFTMIYGLNCGFTNTGDWAFTDSTGEVNITNVDMYGSMSSNHNWANYTVYTMGTVKLSDCDNYVDNIASEQKYIAAFVGYPLGANLEFENCFNYGYLEALQVAALVCNGSQRFTIKMVNSGNKGTLSSVSEVSNGYCAVSYSNGTVLEGSEEVVLGTTKQIPSYNFAANAKMNATTNKLMINKVPADSEIVKVKVTLSFGWMKYEGGTNTAYLSQEFDVNSEVDVETHVYLAGLQNGTPSIKIKMIGDYTKAEGETEVTFKDCEWLKYNVQQQTYVFDGSKIDANNYISWGTPQVTVLAYNANNEVISGSIVNFTVVK